MKYWVLYDFLCRSDLPIATFFVGRNSDSRPLSIFCRSELCSRSPRRDTQTITEIFYSKVQKYVDSSSVNNDPTAAGEDCILASLERPSNYRLYYMNPHLVCDLSSQPLMADR